MSKHYALWITRNGQHLWDGPFRSPAAARGKLAQVIDKASGNLVVSARPAPRKAEPPAALTAEGKCPGSGFAAARVTKQDLSGRARRGICRECGRDIGLTPVNAMMTRHNRPPPPRPLIEVLAEDGEPG